MPDFREDIEGEADLSEEVLRIYGYEHIKSTMLRGETSTGTRNVHMQLADRVERILLRQGALRDPQLLVRQPEAD